MDRTASSVAVKLRFPTKIFFMVSLLNLQSCESGRSRKGADCTGRCERCQNQRACKLQPYSRTKPAGDAVVQKAALQRRRGRGRGCKRPRPMRTGIRGRAGQTRRLKNNCPTTLAGRNKPQKFSRRP